MLFPLCGVVISFALQLDRRIAVLAVYTLRGENLDLRVIDKAELPLCRRNARTGPVKARVSHMSRHSPDIKLTRRCCTCWHDCASDARSRS